MHKAIWALTTLGLMVVSFASGRFIRGLSFYPLPAIVATLPGNEDEFSLELGARIRELFPVGSSEENLVGYLATEGFTPEWRQRNDANASILVHNGLLCKKTIRVYWRADSTGLLTEVNGAYESRCL